MYVLRTGYFVGVVTTVFLVSCVFIRKHLAVIRWDMPTLLFTCRLLKHFGTIHAEYTGNSDCLATSICCQFIDPLPYPHYQWP